MLLTPDEAGIRRAAELLHAGELVAFPTETVYGLGANALDARACAKVFEAKARPAFDPLIVHIPDLAALPQVASGIPELAFELGKRFWPGPLTLVLPKHPALPDLVCAGLPTVAVRVPAHPVAQALLRATGFPIAAPSANPFGYLSPSTAAHVQEQLGARVSLILDGGPCPIGVESSILDLSQGEPRLLRQGGLAQEELEAALGHALQLGPTVLERPLVPGQLASHYAPRLPLRLLSGALTKGEPGSALLRFAGPADAPGYAWVEALSARGDLEEAAANLFAALHRLEVCGAARIDAQLAPENGLGRAINDRLRRAAQRP